MLTLICGMPRAGKTTYSQRFDNVIHIDFTGYPKAKMLVGGTTDDIVVEGVCEHPQMREKFINAYKGQGKRCIWIDTPLEVRKQRPMWHLYNGLTFEPPTLDEGWDEIIIIRGDDEIVISPENEVI